jgi:hypothetical protein
MKDILIVVILAGGSLAAWNLHLRNEAANEAKAIEAAKAKLTKQMTDELQKDNEQRKAFDEELWKK